jgi:hypothetical protein
MLINKSEKPPQPPQQESKSRIKDTLVKISRTIPDYYATICAIFFGGKLHDAESDFDLWNKLLTIARQIQLEPRSYDAKFFSLPSADFFRSNNIENPENVKKISAIIDRISTIIQQTNELANFSLDSHFSEIYFRGSCVARAFLEGDHRRDQKQSRIKDFFAKLATNELSFFLNGPNIDIYFQLNVIHYDMKIQEIIEAIKKEVPELEIIEIQKDFLTIFRIKIENRDVNFIICHNQEIEKHTTSTIFPDLDRKKYKGNYQYLRIVKWLRNPRSYRNAVSSRLSAQRAIFDIEKKELLLPENYAHNLCSPDRTTIIISDASPHALPYSP